MTLPTKQGGGRQHGCISATRGAGRAWRGGTRRAGAGAGPITLQLVEVITSPQRTEVVQSLVDQFEEANPGVTVEITSLPWGQAFEARHDGAGGQIPDVVEMPDRWMALYANNDQLVDLGPYMESWANADQLNERTVEFGSVVNDTMYMVPYGFYLRAMFWNKKLFGEAGLDGPPETMDEFMEASKKISELGGGKPATACAAGRGRQRLHHDDAQHDGPRRLL